MFALFMLFSSSKDFSPRLTLNVVEFLRDLLPTCLSTSFNGNSLVIETKSEDIFFILSVLNLSSNLQFSILSSISLVDYPFRKKRFEVVYELLSVHLNFRARLKACFHELTPLVSCFSLFPCATWYEREIWDLFGVYFLQNSEIKRILTDYGFEGHPLRKDFPLSGYVELRYDDVLKRVVCETLEHAQEFRMFDFTSSSTNTQSKR